MEFFKIVDVRTTEKAIQKKLTLGNLEEFCESIFPLEDNPEVCLTGGMWGNSPYAGMRLWEGSGFPC